MVRFLEDKKVEYSRLPRNELGNRLDPGDVVHAAYNYTFPTKQVYNMNVENSERKFSSYYALDLGSDGT